MGDYTEIASAAAGALRAIFGKSKAAAMAAIVIETAVAAMKAFSSAPNPYVGAVLAALAVAAGAAQLSKASSANYAQGSRNLDYEDFGNESQINAHGREAIIPLARVPALASDIAEGLAAQGSARGGRPIEITLINQMDGRTVTRRVIRLMPRELALSGVSIP